MSGLFALIPLPYRILAALLLAAVLVGGGFYSGHRWATTRADAARARAADDALRQINAELKRNHQMAAQLAAAEGRIVVKTVEVIKHVPAVTTGRLCLGPAAVSLLQPGAAWGPYQSAGQPAAKGGAQFAASDRDVGYWIADANRLYETCAARINALIDWHTAPQP